MNKGIFICLATTSILGFSSCKKNHDLGDTASAKTISLNKETSPIATTSFEKAIKKEAFINMKAIINPADFVNLDWDNAMVSTKDQSNKEITVTVQSKHGNKALVYLSTNTTKMYQWAGEVHLVSHIMTTIDEK